MHFTGEEMKLSMISLQWLVARFYIPLLAKTWMKVVVCVLSLILLSVGIYGATQVCKVFPGSLIQINVQVLFKKLMLCCPLGPGYVLGGPSDSEASADIMLWLWIYCCPKTL